jgi:hypothetical protein
LYIKIEPVIFFSASTTSHPSAPQFNNADFEFVLFLILHPALLLPPFPTLVHYLITMNNFITVSNTEDTVPQLQQAALSEIAALQQAALYKISQLNLPRQQLLEVEVQLCVPNLVSLCDVYVKQDTCQLSQNFKLSKGRIYFHLKYTPDKNGRLALFHDI